MTLCCETRALFFDCSMLCGNIVRINLADAYSNYNRIRWQKRVQLFQRRMPDLSLGPCEKSDIRICPNMS